MRRRTTAIIAVAIGVVLFAYFAPVIYVNPALPANCVYCPMVPYRYYGSLTFVLLGNGAVYQSGQYLINPW